MQSAPTTLRPEPTILLKLPKFSTANSLSCGTVTQQLVHGRQPASCLCWPAMFATRARLSEAEAGFSLLEVRGHRQEP